MLQHPFEIYEIVELVTRLLPLTDQIHCLRVSRIFHAVLVPNVWRKITLIDSASPSGEKSYPSGSALQRYKQHIQEIHVQDQLPSEYSSLQGCHHLRILNIKPRLETVANLSEEHAAMFTRRLFDSLSALIEAHASGIQNVALFMPRTNLAAPPERFWRAILLCSSLDTLELAVISIHKDHMHLFFQVCSKPRTLTLMSMMEPHRVVSLYGAKSADDALDQNENIAGPEKLNILWLSMKASPPLLSSRGQAMLVRKCRNLKCLRWRGILRPPAYEIGWRSKRWHDEEARTFFNTLSMDPWPLNRLESLDLSNIRIEDQELAGLLKQICRLRALMVMNTRFAKLSFEALFMDSNRDGAPRRLCDSLEDLNIQNCDVTSAMNLAFLESCPNLHRFITDTISVSDVSVGQEWVCHGLTDLQCYLQIKMPEDDSGDNASLPDHVLEMQHIAYARLATLKELTRLVLVTMKGSKWSKPARLRTLDLRLRAGLGALAGLKQMRELRFPYDKYQDVGIDDARWMSQNWPQLAIVRGRLSKDDVVLERIKEILSKPDLGLTLEDYLS